MCDGSAFSWGMPGWYANSWGYHSDDGKRFHNSANGVQYGPTCETGDTVGCGFDYKTRSIFFTKNGKHLGIWEVNSHEWKQC